MKKRRKLQAKPHAKQHVKTKPKPNPVALRINGIVQGVQNRFLAVTKELDAAVAAGVSLGSKLADLADRVHALEQDKDHPTTGVLAKRLLAIETGERVTRNMHECITQLEHELRALRTEFGELIQERHIERNRRDVARLADGS